MEAIEHIRYCCVLYDDQLRRGRHVLHKHPWTARSWNLPDIQNPLEKLSVRVVEGHMCRWNMMTHIDKTNGKLGLVKKAIGFMTSSSCIANELGIRCEGGHAHAPLVGGRAAGAQVSPKERCEAIVGGVIQQKVWARASSRRLRQGSSRTSAGRD